MSGEEQVRCLVCGGRGGWWSKGEEMGEHRARCSRCDGTGWEIDPPQYLIHLVGDQQDHDGFTPDDES